MPDTVIVVERNDVALPLGETEIKRGDSKGSKYPTIIVTEENYHDVTKWLGLKLLVKKVQAFINQRAQGLYDEVTDDGKKPFNMDEFLVLFKAFSARGETVGELEEEIKSLMDEMTAPSFWLQPNAADKAKEIAFQIHELNIAKESKRRPRKEDTAVAVPVPAAA